MYKDIGKLALGYIALIAMLFFPLSCMIRNYREAVYEPNPFDVPLVTLNEPSNLVIEKILPALMEQQPCTLYTLPLR
ncbi:MAG: hypothetical protein FWG30_08945 [Eubacteriaceae bacterium]|jgi:hypothetical protein|nr:hypothetical protein [Eubacteriaceae bacterium]